MEIYLIYFGKVILLQTLLFGFYWLISRKSSSFQFNRFFLLSILVLPFFIPLINIPFTLFQPQLNSDSVFDPLFFIEQSLPNMVISGNQMVDQGISLWVIFIISLYIIVAFPSAIKFLIDYYKIYRLGKKSTNKEYTPHGYRLLYVPTRILSFSFLNRIFLSNLFLLKKHEKKTIITHEEYHLIQKHSLDIILSELIRILCWFNPIIMLIQKNLKETHEYLADQHTIRTFGKNDYTTLLKSFKWQEINMMLGSAYSSSSIKNRLRMIEASDHRRQPVLQITILSIITLFTFFLFACNNDLDSFENKDVVYQYELSEADLQKEINKSIGWLKTQNAPQDMIDMYVNEQNGNPEYLYTAYVLNFAGFDQEELQSPEKIKARFESGILEKEVIFFRIIESDENNLNIRTRSFKDEMYPEKISTNRFAVIEKVDRQKHMEYKFKMKGDNIIHGDFDKAAQFKGGITGLSQYLKENLKYPEVAKTMGVEDKVVLRFVVTKLGGLLYLNIDKEPVTSNEEVSLEFQKAAFHAIRETAGMWSPAEKDGKYVMSKMTLPIEFRLDK